MHEVEKVEEPDKPIDPDEIEDLELRKIITTRSEVREAIYQAMNYATDTTAFKTIRRMMETPDVPDGVKKDLLLGWLAHRRADRELHHKITSGRTGGEITFNVSFGTNEELKNVKDTRQAFGLDSAEDAEIR